MRGASSVSTGQVGCSYFDAVVCVYAVPCRCRVPNHHCCRCRLLVSLCAHCVAFAITLAAAQSPPSFPLYARSLSHSYSLFLIIFLFGWLAVYFFIFYYYLGSGGNGICLALESGQRRLLPRSVQ